jgi:hypothetical protein
LTEKARAVSSAAAKANEDAARAGAAADAAAQVEQFGGHLRAVQQARNEIHPLLTEAQAALETVQKQRTIVLDLRKARANDDERRRKEEAQKALVAEETARAALLPDTAAPFFKECRFEEAAQAVSRQLASFKTDEGKRAAGVMTERYRLAADLFAYLVRQLGASPFRWGWERTRGVYEDVYGADKGGVKLRDRVVPWPKVGQAQLVRLVDHCVVPESAGSPTKQARLYLGAAVFFRENASPAIAKRYVDKAVAAAPHMQEEASLFVPLE